MEIRKATGWQRRLIHLMCELKMTPQGLSATMGSSFSRFSTWMTGVRNPGLKTQLKIRELERKYGIRPN